MRPTAPGDPLRGVTRISRDDRLILMSDGVAGPGLLPTGRVRAVGRGPAPRGVDGPLLYASAARKVIRGVVLSGWPGSGSGFSRRSSVLVGASPPGGVSSAAGGASAGSRARFWRFGRIVRAGAPDALSGFRMIPRFLWGRCGAGDGTILPGRQNRARRPPRRDAGRGGTAEPTPPGAADDEDHDADPAPEHPRRPGEKGPPRPMGADHHHIAPRKSAQTPAE